MSNLKEDFRCRLVIETDTTSDLENLLEFIGRSLDNGVLIAKFTWYAEEVLSWTLEEENGNA